MNMFVKWLLRPLIKQKSLIQIGAEMKEWAEELSKDYKELEVYEPINELTTTELMEYEIKVQRFYNKYVAATK